MKILHIIDSMGLGGAQTVVKGIFEAQKDNDQIFLYALRERDKRINIDHPNIFTHPSSKRFSLKPLNDLKKIIASEKIDILHCHLFRSQVFGWLLKLRHFKKIKLVFHEHGEIFENKIIFKLFLRLSRPELNLHIAVSKATMNYLIKNAQVAKSNIKVLYNCVDTEMYEYITNKSKAKEREKMSINTNDFVVGFAGRLIEMKGWKVFVGAVDLVEKILPEAKFLIAGDGKDRAKLLKLIESKHLKNKVNFLGYVTDMAWFYSLLDCFVIPSHWESMGLTEIEAQASGIPVIASDVEALNEIIVDRKDGLLFESGNDQDLADRIIEIFTNDALRKSLIIKGKANIRKYDLDIYLMSLGNLYKNLDINLNNISS